MGLGDASGNSGNLAIWPFMVVVAAASPWAAAGLEWLFRRRVLRRTRAIVEWGVSSASSSRGAEPLPSSSSLSSTESPESGGGTD